MFLWFVLSAPVDGRKRTTDDGTLSVRSFEQFLAEPPLEPLQPRGEVDGRDIKRWAAQLGISIFLLGHAKREAGAEHRKQGQGRSAVWFLPKPVPVSALGGGSVQAVAPITAASTASNVAPSDQAGKHPGHVRKPYRTGRKRNEDREAVLEYCYDEYIGKGKPQGDVLRAVKMWFGPSEHLPTTKDQVRAFAREWAERWVPSLPLARGWMRSRGEQTGGGGNSPVSASV
jgi:hypothetical protein